MTRTTLSEEDIFQVARRIEAVEARAAYLGQVCHDDARLREQVEALLRAYDESQSFLEVSPGAAMAVEVAAAPTIDQPIVEQVGAKIGPYKLLQQIGEGGMGAVYMAEQQEPVRRKVAFKIIKPGMDTRQVIARFEAERQALSLMDHPNIARVLDAGTTDRGRPYFVMELVKGQPITQYCDEKRLTPRQRLELLLPVCQAIQHAHQKGIIHRDIKPSNVIVAEYDQKAVPKVIDFGVAKAISQPLTEKTMFTGYGQIVGTLEYMSPEQAKVNQLDIDTRSDIYSLGVLLYELLTGSTPFDRQRLRSAAWDEMLRVIREEEPPKPSTRLSDSKDSLPSISAQRQTEPAKLTRLIRGEIDWIVMKALEKDRTRRYETATGLAADLQRYLNDEPVTACPPSTGYRLRKFVRRNKTGLGITTASALAILLVVGIFGWMVRDRVARETQVVWERQAREQQIASEKAERQARLEERIREALDESYAQYERDRVPEAFDALKRAEVLLAGGEFVGDELRQRLTEWQADLSVAARLEDLDLSFGNHEDSPQFDADYLRLFRSLDIDVDELPVEEAGRRIQSRRIRRSLTEGLDVWALVRHELYWIRIRSGPMTDKNRLLQVARAADPHELRSQARRIAEEFDGSAARRLIELPETTLLPAPLLRHLAMLLYWTEDPLLAAADKTRAARLLEDATLRQPGEFRLHSSCGGFYYRAESWGDASNAYRRALAIRPGHARLQTWLGRSYVQQGALEQGIICCRRAMEVDPKYAGAHAELGYALQKQGKLDEAIACYEKAIALDPKDARTQSSLGNALANKGQVDEAIACYRKAIELDPKYALAHKNLGVALNAQGKLGEAIEHFRKVTELKPDSAAAYADLGVVLRVNHQLEEAVACYRKTLEIDPNHDVALNNLGVFLHSQGKFDEAIVCFQKAIESAPKFPGNYDFLGAILCDVKQDYDGAIAVFRQELALDPNNSKTHVNLGVAFHKKGHLDNAILCFRKAIELAPTFVKAHRLLGIDLETQGKLDESLAAWRRIKELAPVESELAKETVAAIRRLETKIALSNRLPAILQGNDQPQDVSERLVFAQLAYQQNRHAGAARLWSDALQADQNLGDDRQAQHRYNAACAAALAGCGQGRDEPTPDELTRSKLRQQALEWLRVELTAWAKLLESPGDIQRENISRTLRHWQVDADLRGIREATEMAKLPPEEQSLFEQLWKDVATLRTRADSPTK